MCIHCETTPYPEPTESSLDPVTRELMSLSRELGNKDGTVRAISEENQRIRDENRGLEQDLSSAQSRIRSLERQIEEGRAELELLKAKVKK